MTTRGVQVTIYFKPTDTQLIAPGRRRTTSHDFDDPTRAARRKVMHKPQTSVLSSLAVWTTLTWAKSTCGVYMRR